MLVTGHLVHFKFLLILVFFLLSHSANSQIFPEPKVDSLLRTGINYVIDQKYDEAKSVFNSLDQKFPDLPFGKIYLAATEIAYAYDFDLPFNTKFIESNLEKAQAISEEILTRNRNNKWNVYFFALTRGYSAYYQALQGNWFDGLKTGLSSVSAFEECIELDAEFYEAWVAIGTYEYWKSRKIEFLSWLPFINDNKDFGIEKLNYAIELSNYNTHIALHSLIWIYIDQKNYSESIELAQYAVEKHPESRIFKWGLARSFEDIDPQKSIDIYFEILESYKKTGVRTRINEVTLKHVIAQQYVKLGNKDKAKKLCEEILILNDLTKYEKEKLEDRIKRVRALLTELF